MTKRRLATAPRKFWTADEDALFRELYPEHRTEDLLSRFPARTLRGLYARAKSLRIEKSDAFKASPASGRTNGRQGIGTRFTKGQTPANKGRRCEEGKGGRHPNARRTQFKRGQEPHNAKHLGHERVNCDGYVEISIAETNPQTGYGRRYVLKHRWEWEQKRGKIPAGFALKCVGDDTTNTDPSNWTLVPRAILPRLAGGAHRTKLAYDDAPPELKPVVLAIAQLEHAAREKSA